MKSGGAARSAGVYAGLTFALKPLTFPPFAPDPSRANV
jgi:hypothetical protein